MIIMDIRGMFTKNCKKKIICNKLLRDDLKIPARQSPGQLYIDFIFGFNFTQFNK